MQLTNATTTLRACAAVGVGAAVLAVTACAASNAGTPAPAMSGPVTFRTASGAAGCAVTPMRATCGNDQLQMRSVPLALVLDRTGSPRVVKERFTWSRSAPVLARGSVRRVADFTCRGTSDGGLLCLNRSRAGIVASDERVSVLLPPTR